MYLKTRSFVVEAGKVIFTISIVLWFLATNSPKNEAFFQTKYQEYQQLSSNTDISMDAVRLEYSYAGYLGKIVEPAIKPLGYDWKIGIALISSFAAREVFVGTLSTIYSVGSEDEQPVIERLKKEVNIKTGLPRYDTATNVSLLLFYVFALQCMSTLAVVRKETGHWKFAFMQFFVFTLIAYVFAFAAYQIIK
ncbi:MAG: nucleoside recognition domain-containing protein [Saprospiraceae bacterium]